MSKKYFLFPSVLLTGGIGGESGEITDPSSGQGTPDHPFACEYATWLQRFSGNYYDPDHSGIDFDDYRFWYNQNFGTEHWREINGDISITPGDPFPNP